MVELVEIKTQGDRDRNTPLAQIGGLGLFTKEIQRALLDGSVDLAVHSLKDLPTQGPPDSSWVRSRSARIRPMPSLPLGSGRSTGYPRLDGRHRVASATGAAAASAAGLKVVGLRGNVETRLNQALGGTLDAVVLAESGLRRLGLDVHVTEQLGPPRFLPAAGQGAAGSNAGSDLGNAPAPRCTRRCADSSRRARRAWPSRNSRAGA